MNGLLSKLTAFSLPWIPTWLGIQATITIMSSIKANRKQAAAAVELMECPVCLEIMSAPIYQCESGHSLCNPCKSNLHPPICPICRQNMTNVRNLQLEEILAKAKVACPNKPAGCVYLMANKDVENHLKECIFRMMDCPLGVVFGRCSWNGKLTDMMAHFKERHGSHCNISSDSDVEVPVNMNEDDRHVYIIPRGKLLFIITMKLDTLQKKVYWTIQHIGSKKVAREYIYEIHVTSKQDPRRKVVFYEHCFNDAIKADEIFRQAKCAVMPFELFVHFVKDQKLTFRFFLKGPMTAKKNDGGENENKPPNSKPKGPGPKGPKGPNPDVKENKGIPGPKKGNKLQA